MPDTDNRTPLGLGLGCLLAQLPGVALAEFAVHQLQHFQVKVIAHEAIETNHAVTRAHPSLVDVPQISLIPIRNRDFSGVINARRRR
jgi:hypothetical protein